MLTICIPAFDEAATVGLVLWRLRKVFEENPREYEVVVLDDGSTDATSETLKPYARVMPLTVMRHAERRGYPAALDALVRAAAARTKYPRRDALIIMQGDFTDLPEHLAELVRPFDGGADLVVGEYAAPAEEPAPVRRLRRLAPWLMRPFGRISGVRDPLGTMRLARVSVVREAIKRAGDQPLVSAPGWAANAELLAALAPCARRVETVPLGAPRYDLRQRSTRVRAFRGAMELLRFARSRRAAQRA
jgi:glycosyltransferase involved in cell wall biosynthesis